MKKPEIILIGAGPHAHACIDVIEQEGRFRIAGLVGLPEEVGASHFGYTVIATDAEMQRLAAEYRYALVTVGQVESPDVRIRLYEQARDHGFSLPCVVAPDAYISGHAQLAAGTIVMHGAIINAGARVGHNCIINSLALVEHDAVVGDHCHVSTGAILNGSVELGAGSFVGSGSVLKDGISIGERCVIGMGLCVRHDQANTTNFVGKNDNEK